MSDQAKPAAKAPALVIPEKPALKTDHPTRSCETCDHSFFPREGEDGGQCRIDPPKAFTFLVPPAIQGQAPRDMNVSSWPIVYRNHFCGSGYRRKPELTQ